MQVRFRYADFERAPTTVTEYDSHSEHDACALSCPGTTTVAPTDVPPELTHVTLMPQTSIQGARS
jgi:hypothetical protein